MVTISVISQKGGVGKSTTAQALACYFKETYKVLLIDMDSQCNTTFYSGTAPKQHGILGVLNNANTTENEIVESPLGFDVIPCTSNFAQIDVLLTETGKEYRLSEGLENVKTNYDYCIIDTPPHVGIALINALTASNYAIIPTLLDIFSLQGIADINSTILSIKKYTNKSLEVLGIVIDKYYKRHGLTVGIEPKLNEIAELMRTKVFKQKIRESVAIREAQIQRKNLLTIDCNASIDFLKFCEEVNNDILIKHSEKAEKEIIEKYGKQYGISTGNK